MNTVDAFGSKPVRWCWPGRAWGATRMDQSTYAPLTRSSIVTIKPVFNELTAAAELRVNGIGLLRKQAGASGSRWLRAAVK